MAINFNDRYPDNSEPSSTAYPLGSARNSTTETAKDGWGMEKDWINEFIGFLQAIRNAKTFTPSGTPDTALASQYFNALNSTDVNIGRLAEGFANLGDGSNITIGNDSAYKALLSWSALLMQHTPGDNYDVKASYGGKGVTFGGVGRLGPGDEATILSMATFNVDDVSDITIADNIITFPFTSGGDLSLTGIPWGSKIHSVTYQADTALPGFKISGHLTCMMEDESDNVGIASAYGACVGTSFLILPFTNVKFIVTYDSSLVD